MRSLLSVRRQKPLALFLDYDGTLVPIAPTPAEAVPSPELLTALQKCALRPDTRITIISGRPMEQLKEFFSSLPICLVAEHGGEILCQGEELAGPFPMSQEEEEKARQEFFQYAEKLFGSLLAEKPEKYRGIWLERKKRTLACHFRLAAEEEAAEFLERWKEKVSPFLAPLNLEFLPGKKVLEIRPAYMNKGAAVEYLMTLWPDAYPVFIGDDITDEDVFLRLSTKGLTIRVGLEGETSARYRLAGPAEVLRLLQGLGG